MKRLLLSLLFAIPLAAQTADLRTLIDVSPDAVPPGTVIPFVVTIENLGPDTATEVEFLAGGGNDVCTNQKIPSLAKGERRTVSCQTVASPESYSTTIAASAFSREITDPDRTNDNVQIVIRTITPPDLVIHSFPPHVVDPGLPFTLRVGYWNSAHTDAKNVTITIIAPQVAHAGSLPEGCTFANSTITCAVGDLPARPLGGIPDFKNLQLELIAPDASNLTFPIALQIRADGPDFLPGTNLFETAARTYRTFFVTNTNDSGSGSLRQAIDDANAECREAGYCKIAFRIPPTGAKWHTITTQSPLPMLITATEVDGLVQARYFSDTNEAGPEIEISGAALREGNAFTYACNASFSGMVINGFPGSAIESVQATCSQATESRISYFSAIERNYLGTDPTGMIAVPNLRGVHLGFGAPWSIRDNVISGNRRAGIFVDSGRPLIERNLIGVNRIPNAGLGNGASGIYIGANADGTDARDNYIGFNAHWGIALHADARWNAYHGNSFLYNVNEAIDFGMDGPSEGIPELEGGGTVFRPEITSARYDPVADETIVEGSSRTVIQDYEVWVNVYSNDEPDPSGYGEGQYYLGAVKANQDQSFRFTFKGRAPGRWIAATTTRINIIGLAKSPRIEAIHGSGFVTTTTEFSRTVQLQ